MRYMIVLIIVLILAWTWWPEEPPPPVEETFIAPQLRALNKAENLEADYLSGLEERKEQIEKQAGG